jgi:hypothetical protein
VALVSMKGKINRMRYTATKIMASVRAATANWTVGGRWPAGWGNFVNDIWKEINCIYNFTGDYPHFTYNKVNWCLTKHAHYCGVQRQLHSQKSRPLIRKLHVAVLIGLENRMLNASYILSIGFDVVVMHSQRVSYIHWQRFGVGSNVEVYDNESVVFYLVEDCFKLKVCFQATYG